MRGPVRIRRALQALAAPEPALPEDLPDAFLRLYARTRPYTMTTAERMYSLYESVRYVVNAGIKGDLVECGVWRGGSSMMAALTLRECKARRRLWLYDTFEGMPPPGELDVAYHGERARVQHAREEMARAERRPGVSNVWAWATLEDVKANLSATGYEDCEYVVGRVEETVPGTAPGEVALLRLDTDWYESTRHELEHLYPRLTEGGVLILDDYGHWQGARQAVDEYFADRPVLLHRIDYSGRLVIKP